MNTALWIVVFALPLAAQPKRLANAQVDTRAVTAGALDREFRAVEQAQPQPAWIAWIVPAARTRNFGCDYSTHEGETHIAGGPVHLEPPAELLILFRVAGSLTERVRTLAPDCEIDAGGVPLHWLSGVAPAESVALLSRLAATGNRMSEGAIAAIALHADGAADTALEGFARADQPEAMRRRAVRWLGIARGRRGFDAVRRLLAEDANPRLREGAVKALALSSEPEAFDLLLATSHDDRSAGVRGQAISWLGRKGGPKAVTALQRAMDSDPERTVRLRAVSALRELPNREGIPLLIEIARTSRDTDMRKRAMSTLAQSRDPQAVAFFEQVLAVK